MLLKLFLILFLSFNIFGCGLTGYYGNSEIKVSEEEVQARLQSKSFVGKTKEEVIQAYGEHRAINYNVRQHDGYLGNPNTYTVYDEVWTYKYEAGITLIAPDQYFIKFYFIGETVVLVTG